MKALVKVGEFAWLDPSAVHALIDVGPGCIVILSSGEQVTLHGLSTDEVLEAFETAFAEVNDGD